VECDALRDRHIFGDYIAGEWVVVLGRIGPLGRIISPRSSRLRDNRDPAFRCIRLIAGTWVCFAGGCPRPGIGADFADSCISDFRNRDAVHRCLDQ
jgi:hypothetical protein